MNYLKELLESLYFNDKDDNEDYTNHYIKNNETIPTPNAVSSYKTNFATAFKMENGMWYIKKRSGSFIRTIDGHLSIFSYNEMKDEMNYLHQKSINPDI